MEATPGPAAPRPIRRWSAAKLLRFAALPALVGALVGTGAFERLIPQDPHARVAEEAGAEMLALPGFEDRFGSLEADEAFATGAELGIAAIPRLPDPELGEWLTITRQLLDAFDVEMCAAVVRGSSDAADALDAFKAIELRTFTRYLEILMVGVDLVLTDAPGPPPASQQEIDAATVLLAQEIGTTRMQEIGSALADPLGASDSDICAAGRDLYDGLAALDVRSRGILIRAMNGPGPSA